MRHKITKLGNGLRVVTVPIPSLDSATVTVWVKVGSRAESAKIAGLSHFLEHMVFKGSQSRPSAKAIAEAVDAIGGEVNAGTTKEWTNFYIKARSENLALAFDVLSDMVLRPLLKAEEIEREKGVIIEEMAMYEDTPIMKIGDVFESLLFSGDALGRDTIGSEASVRSLQRNDFERYRDIHYDASNLVVSVAGGIKEAVAIALAKKYFGGLKAGRKKSGKEYHFAATQGSPRVSLKSKKNEQAHFILGFFAGKRGNKDRFIEEVLAAILGGGMSSRLFTEVRERRGLAYTVKSSVDNFIDTGEFYSYAGVDIPKAEEAITVILEQHYGMTNGQFPITKKELQIAKEYLKGHFALSLEDTKEVNNLYGETLLMLDRVETPEEIVKGIDKVTLEDVTRRAKALFVPGRVNLAIIGPYQDSKRFEKLLRI